MEEDINTEELLEAAEDTCRQLKREQEELDERAEQLKTRMRMAEATKSMLNRMKQLEDENRLLRETNEEQERQLQEKDMLLQEKERQLQEQERQLQEKDILLKEKDIQLQEKDTQLKELNKLSAGVAKKSSQDDVSQALRIYLNTSKRKTLAKREAAKTVFLELIAAAKLDVPEEIMDLLNHFDDEQLVEQPPVTTGGGVNADLAELFSAEAQVLWQRLRDAGFIVADGYALAEGISANQAAYIADRMAERLQIKKKWKLFQQLWGIANLAQLAGTWQQTGKLPPRSSEIDKLME